MGFASNVHKRFWHIDTCFVIIIVVVVGTRKTLLIGVRSRVYDSEFKWA